MGYFIILILLFVITYTVQKTARIELYKNKRQMFLTNGFFLLIGVTWDSFAIQQGHWIYPEGKTIGLTIGLIPLEDYLFVLIIPYFVITFYYLLSKITR